jgi:hypothetical protein
MIGMTFLFPDHPGIAAANLFDRFVETRIQREMDLWREGSGGSLWVARTASFVEFLWEIIASYPDTLRFGSGVDDAIRSVIRGDLARGDLTAIEEGLWNDFLRALNIIPVGRLLGKGLSRASHLLSITQRAGSSTCMWVTHTNAARVAGQALFLGDDELMRAAGVTAAEINHGGGTGIAGLRKLQAGYRRLGIRAVEHSMSSLTEFDRVVRTKPQSVFTVGIRFPSGRGHRIYARFSARLRDVVFVDTNRAEYVGLAGLLQQYPGAVLSRLPIMELPNSVLVRGNDFVQLFFPVARVTLSGPDERDPVLAGRPRGGPSLLRGTNEAHGALGLRAPSSEERRRIVRERGQQR